MFRVLATLIFIILLAQWLRFELKRSVSLTRYWKWIAAALFLQLAANIAFSFLTNTTGNFIYHAVGGGVMSALTFVYLRKTFELKVNWRLELVLLYAFVSALGVLNELGEYAGELLHIGTYSFDTHDTWRDLVANTVGALGAWLLYTIITRLRPASKTAPTIRR